MRIAISIIRFYNEIFLNYEDYSTKNYKLYKK
jgi:DNA-binding transcriptional MerR regulator